MLSVAATDTEGRSLQLPAPLSMTIRMEEDVPADDLYAVFPQVGCGELCAITVYDADKIVFTGIIDEEEHISSSSGRYLRISARSLAALLLDNEAPPCNYDHPSARLLFERHVEDYGIKAGDTDDAVCFGELNITKGMSQWSVISAFSGACYSGSPRVSADGVLYLKGLPSGGEVIFGKGGVRYTEITDCRRRCEELSRVNVKIEAGGGYGYPVNNDDALRRGIRRERYLNAMLDTRVFKTAETMLNKSRDKSHYWQLKCPGRLTDILGSAAVIRDNDEVSRDDLYVSAIRYQMNSTGEHTVVKFKRRWGSCGSPDI